MVQAVCLLSYQILRIVVTCTALILPIFLPSSSSSFSDHPLEYSPALTQLVNCYILYYETTGNDRHIAVCIMKFLAVLSHLSLAAAVACPFGQLKEAGLLNEAELTKYEEVKRGGGHLEERAGSALLPITLPGLSLPLGGGLCEYLLLCSWPLH